MKVAGLCLLKFCNYFITNLIALYVFCLFYSNIQQCFFCFVLGIFLHIFCCCNNVEKLFFGFLVLSLVSNFCNIDASWLCSLSVLSKFNIILQMLSKWYQTELQLSKPFAESVSLILLCENQFFTVRILSCYIFFFNFSLNVAMTRETHSTLFSVSISFFPLFFIFYYLFEPAIYIQIYFI